ncbi:Uncharacterized Fe-S cluster protein YjdI [Pedobacter steynii]|uniref:Uncharacterized Fe-S cluster protein YjdI n=1 Tax=Pedobacter steynii TaxID=430522 RepID=A0A1H0L0Q6_9SPHI|nr:(4Fe-4S)-binding protein [Pedobacter steynii]NQX43387.1 (4Fe-4S)-binding protein [Pedobacter steynii]SDO61787.1 Uncharacterized Fe-S cluster protein YjdI [Pedobacter steynii]
MKDITKKYSNGEVTIVWKPGVCIHSKICWRGLAEVFNPAERPWIKPEAATTDQIIAQVKRCPSGALSYYLNDQVEEPQESHAESIVEAVPNGPLLVYGNLIVKDKEGNETRKNKVTAFCRCGASANKPYCDGTHTKIGFSS